MSKHLVMLGKKNSMWKETFSGSGNLREGKSSAMSLFEYIILDRII